MVCSQSVGVIIPNLFIYCYKHVYHVFFRNSTFILFCHILSAVEDKFAKTTRSPIFQYLSIFLFWIINLYNHKRLCDCDMKCDVCNKLIIVVCDSSAVKGFKQKFETMFMCACLCPYCQSVHTSLQLYINLPTISECVMCTLNCYIMR